MIWDTLYTIAKTLVLFTVLELNQGGYASLGIFCGAQL